MNVLKAVLRPITAYWGWARARRTTWGKWLAFGLPTVLVLLIILSVIGSATGGNKNTNEATAPKATKTAKPTNTPKVVATNTPKTTTAEPTIGATASATATATAAPVPTETPVVLKTVNAGSLLSVDDVPSGYSVVTVGLLANPGPGSVLADPSTYTACGPGPEESLDIGFGVDQIKGPFIGETLKASPSVDAADKAMSDAASRVESCTKTGEGLGIASISVSAQSIPEDLGDSVKGFKVILNQESGTAALSYVLLIRRTNVVVTIFYMSFTGQGDIDQLIGVARTAANKVS